MCFLCDGSPVEGDDRAHGQTFQTTMCKSPVDNCPRFCFAFICPCLSACLLRRQVLEGDMSKYSCCQGYVPICGCDKPNCCGAQSCPNFCNCVEASVCCSFSVSSTRAYVMDQRGLQSDPCDRRLIRLNNFCATLSCICDIIACFYEPCRNAANVMRNISRIIFLCTQACMQSQTDFELKSVAAPSKHAGPSHQSMT